MTTQTPTDALRLVPVEPTEAMVADGVKAAQRAEQTCVSWPEMALFTYRAMLAAAPASPLPGGGWQDISTAPKDGTIILTYGSLHNDGAPYGIGETPTVKISQYSQEGEFWCCDAWGSHEPVWWMPLPAAPTGDA